MNDYIRFVGPNHALQVFGVKLVGLNAENGWKVIFSLGFLLVLFGLSWVLRVLARRLLRNRRYRRTGFWTLQATHLATAILLILGMGSIWFDDPARLATAVGLVTAGVAFALQKAITAVAGYFVILRGRTFNVGDRIRMGGVRGDVIDLGFMQTTIMEMGEPPEEQGDNAGSWVKSRQYTGRVVTVSNAHIFDQPVYNYTRNFPFIWEEMHVPVPYAADRRKAEQILLEAARRHAAAEEELSSQVLAELERRYGTPVGVRPRVYYRLTDNWVEMAVRFVVRDHGIRAVKDAIAREVLERFEQAGISIASGTYDIVGLPPLRVEGLTPAMHVEVVGMRPSDLSRDSKSADPSPSMP